VNVRSGPSGAYAVVGALSAGQSAFVNGWNGNRTDTWWYVFFPTGPGDHAWVRAIEVTPVCIAADPPLVPTPTLPVTNPPAATPKPPTATQVPPAATATSGLATMDSGAWIGDQSDIQVLKVWATSLTAPGKIGIDIRNNGPKEFSGSFHVVCTGVSFNRAIPNATIPIASEETVPDDISVGTGFFYTSLEVDPATYSYPVIQCTVGVPDNKDPNPNNNAGATNIP
jgi:hypothetical protein